MGGVPVVEAVPQIAVGAIHELKGRPHGCNDWRAAVGRYERRVPPVPLLHGVIHWQKRLEVWRTVEAAAAVAAVAAAEAAGVSTAALVAQMARVTREAVAA